MVQNAAADPEAQNLKARAGHMTDRSGIIRRLGWDKDEDGKDVFRAVVEYPNGPPDNLPMAVVWDSLPVKIVLHGTVAQPALTEWRDARQAIFDAKSDEDASVRFNRLAAAEHRLMEIAREIK